MEITPRTTLPKSMNTKQGNQASRSVQQDASSLFSLFRSTGKLVLGQNERATRLRSLFSQSIARLQQGSGAAVSTLLKIMVDPNSPPSTLVRAADSVLGQRRESD